MNLPPEDVLAIQQLVAEISYVVDERRWDDLPSVYTQDGVFDASQAGYPAAEGQAALRRHMETANHPVAHHTTNTVVRPIDADSANVVSMIIGAWSERDISAGVGTYRDYVVRTPEGWRVKRRTVVMKEEYVPRL